MFGWLRKLFEPPRAPSVVTVAAVPSADAPLPTTTAELITVLLESTSEARRVKAANALSEKLPHDRNLIVPALVKATHESSAAVRRAARAPMSHGRIGAALPGVVEALREGLDEADASDRAGVIAALGSLTGYSDDFFADMNRCLGDGDKGVRSSAAYYLAEFLGRGRAPTEVMWAALEDPSPEVRRYLMRGLGRHTPGDARVQAVVLEVLRHADARPYQLDAAVEVVTRLPEDGAAALLDRAALPDDHPGRVRVAAIRTHFPALAARGVEELEALLAGSELQRVLALGAAPKVRPRLDVHVLRAAAPAMSAPVRAAALRAARELQLPAGQRLELVRASIDSGEGAVRRASHDLLGTLSHERTADVLELCVARLDSRDSDELARILGWLGSRAEPAVPKLVARLEQRPTSTLAYALGSIGSSARPAVAALARLALAGSEAYVRSTAVEALCRIGLGQPGHDVLALVLKLAAGDDAKLRDGALSALETVEAPAPPQVRDALMQSVVKEEGLPDVRRRRVARLATLGPEVTPALVRALEDRDEQVAAEALRAFERMGDEAVPELQRMRDDPACTDGPRAAFVLDHLARRR
ncbi:MAG: HEAT repeat domain-containing protein [Myxococcaceae bacterium]|nr:HEAT repeat domain-containing protein [Myxococcaceae bacterium]